MAEISVKLNPANTGQVFACYGLFEMVHRLTPSGNAKAYFCEDDTRFVISDAGCDLSNVLNTLQRASPEEDQNTEVIILRFDEGVDPLVLDWWLADNALKTWAGQQKIAEIVRALLGALSRATGKVFGEALFDWGTMLLDSEGKAVSTTAFDCRLSRLTSLDVGFSMNDQGLKPLVYPAVEFFALIGIQRFRPTRDEGLRQWCCFTWSQPLPILIASSIAQGMWFVTARERSFSVRFRDEGRRYKALGQSLVLLEHPFERGVI